MAESSDGWVDEASLTSPVCGSMANPFLRGDGGLRFPYTGSGCKNGNQHVEHESERAITTVLTRLSGEGGGGSDIGRCWAGAPPGGTRLVVDIDAELL